MRVRWYRQMLTAEDPDALPGLGRMPGLVRTVRTPEFAGMTFHEVHCRSALNRVPGAAPLPFGWTINPYRGCTHGCVYCFARQTHAYLELDAGHDFDTQIVVKVNIAEVLRASWPGRAGPGARGDGDQHRPVPAGGGSVPVDAGDHRALADTGTPFSILTKGTLLSRDLGLLAEAATRVPVGVAISLALLAGDCTRSRTGDPTPRPGWS